MREKYIPALFGVVSYPTTKNLASDRSLEIALLIISKKGQKRQ
jgi:uncharacterized membrane protein